MVEVPTLDGSAAVEPFTISEKEITEDNFSGTVAQVEGDTPVAKAASDYIERVVSEFKISADQEVPQMRKQFGPDSPPATYSIDVNASRVESEDTESAVISVYTYTGGAHGSTAYKVFTGSRTSGALLSLEDVIKGEKKAEFTAYVKNKLLDWNPDGSGQVVFPEEVGKLTFPSFSSWSLSSENLTLYFSQYEIGPGVLGAVAFPLPLAEVKDFLIKI